MEARMGTGEGLLERDRELAALDRLIDEAEEGRGRVALIEGPAGIGKSRLLAEARDRAERRMTVLAARCSELERDFSFGAVRQLLEGAIRDPASRERVLAGAAAPAEGVLEAAEDGAGEGSFAVLHGLYWATLNLAEERPVLLAIDDIQWSDRPTLRFVAYLARRLEGAPVLVAATLRSTDPGTDPALLSDITGDPLCEPVRPAPLGEEAVAELVRDRLGPDADGAFIAACQEATGGNPLLLGQLLAGLAADGVSPTAAGAEAVRQIGPRAVSRTVLLRISRLPAETVAVARAVAVLGESSALPAVATLTGLSEEDVARAAGELARADVLRPDPPLGFVHPLVRDAVYGDLPAAERELQHGRAAEVLRDAGASEEEVAAQLVHAPRRGDAGAVELLRRAAARASRRGGPESAITYLARALEEPPPPELRAQVLLELGLAEWQMNAPSAAEHLRAAYDGISDPSVRASAAFALGHALMFTGHAAEAGELLRRAVDELPSAMADERQALMTTEAFAVYFGGPDLDAVRRLEPYRESREGDGPGARMIAAAAAFAWSVGGGPASECEALALESLAAGDLLSAGGGVVWSAAIIALVLSESARTPEFLAAAREDAFRHGSVLTTSSVEMFTGLWQLATGQLDDAIEGLQHSRQLQYQWGSDRTGTSWARALVAEHARLTGDAARARTELGPAPAPEDGSDGANLWRRTHAELLLADGHADEALEVAELMGSTAPQVLHPDWKPWQSLKARALVALGRRDEGLAAMEAELDLARAVGAPGVVGRCLRQLGELEGEAGMDHLREAVDTLAGSRARLERARALFALGRALRLARNPSDARDPLRHALELAEACGAPPLAEEVRSELYATGARPRTAALGGVEALTAREMRVAELAADGRSNREIAQALYVTPKTVEVHLSNAYRKLEIRSRRELPAALAG